MDSATLKLRNNACPIQPFAHNNLIKAISGMILLNHVYNVQITVHHV